MKTKIKINIFLAFFYFLLISLNCGKEVSENPVIPEPEEGFLLVNSDPQGAHIFLNDKNTGRLTPDSLIYLNYGVYSVILKKNYFKDTSLSILIKENEKAELFVDYKLNPSMYGRISLSSVPQGAAILINDSLISGTTPLTIAGILPGVYNVTFKLDNHEDGKIIATVWSDQISNYNLILRDTSVWLDYRTTNSGLQSNNLTSIAIDYNGIKWIGSTDRGLISFDGVNFNNYSTLNSSIPDNAINCISISLDNKVWVGTNHGIGVFDGSSWQIFHNNNSGLISNIINSIVFDEEGTAWIGGYSGLYKFNGIAWVRYYNEGWVLSTHITDDKIWIGTNSEGIIALEADSLIYYPAGIFFYPSNKITSIASDHSGNIWFSHSPDTNLQSGVSFYNGNSFTSFLFGIRNTPINHIIVDEFNNKWVSTFEGLLKYDANNSSQTFSAANSLISSKRVTASIVDDNNDLWITTSGSGLNKFKWNQR